MVDEKTGTDSPRILIVEDEAIIAMRLEQLLTHLDYDVVGMASRGEDAISAVAEQQPDLILMDIKLAGELDGVETAARIRERFDTPIVYLSAHPERMITEEVQRTQPAGFLSKPVRNQELLATVEMALYKHRMETKLRESEAKLRALTNATEQSFVLLDRDGVVLACNRVAQTNTHAVFGVTIQPGDAIEQFVLERDRAGFAANFACALNGDIVHAERPFTQVDGTTRWFAFTYHPVVEDGQVTSVGFNTIDITKRKRAEIAQEESLARYDELTTRVPVGVYVAWLRADGTTDFEYVSERWCEIHQVQGEAVLADASTVNGLVHPDDQADFSARNQETIRTHQPFLWEGRFIVGDETRWLRLESTCTVMDNGDIHWFGVTQDITKRKQAEEEIEGERAFLSAVLDNIEESVVICDKEGRIVRFNEAARRLHGVPEYPIPPEKWGAYYDLYQADGVTPLPTEEISLFRALQGEHVQDAEIVVNPEHSDPRSLVCNGQSLTDTAGEVTGAVVTMHDITDRKQAQEALRQEKDKVQNYLDIAGVMFVALDEEGNVTLINRKGSEILGYEQKEIIGQNWIERFIPERMQDEAQAIFGGIMKSGRIAPFESVDGYVVLTKSGEERSMLWHNTLLKDDAGVVIGALSSGEDITERKQMEVQLQDYTQHLEQMVEEKVHELERERAKIIQMDKMSALGQMATGVAHELNQPLTAITLDADYLKTVAQKLESDPASCPELLTPDALIKMGESFMDSVQRCRRIVDHLRTFGRVSTGPLTPIDLEQPISDSLILTTARLREHNIDLRLNFADDLPLILADPHKLEQVFLNLIANAEYALEKRDKGNARVLEITTYGEGDHVVATVRDTGCGIPEAVQAHLFEPFYTTKPEGEGTGLGLSISHDIVTEFDGEITCESTVGEGTTFTLRFPAVDPTKAIA